MINEILLYDYFMHYLHIDNLKDSKKRSSIVEKICQEELVHVSISFPADFCSSKILRNIIEEFCTYIHITPLWKMRFILVSDELNNNSIEYGSKAWEENRCIFKVQKQYDTCEVFLEVIDTGNGSAHKNAAQMQELQRQHIWKDFWKHTSIRWRGLFLIVSDLVDTLSFRDTPEGGLAVAVELQLPKLVSNESKENYKLSRNSKVLNQ